MRYRGARARRLVAGMAIAALMVPAAATAGSPDAADTCATATPIAVGAVWTLEPLATTGDRDWFTFTLPARTTAVVTLGNLQTDSTLQLQAACGATIATSNRSGLQYEELVQTLPAGTYHVRVAAVGPGVGTRPYGIRVRTFSAQVVILSSSGWEPTTDRPRIAGEVLNLTRVAREDVKIKVSFYDAADHLIMSQATYARRERFRPGQRSMFLWSDELVPGYDHYRLSVAAAPISSYPPLTGLVVHPGGTTPDGFGGLTYFGTLQNTTTHLVGIPRVMVTIYDVWGQVWNAAFTDTAPDPMAAGATNDYEVYLADRTTGNRVTIVSHGYRN